MRRSILLRVLPLLIFLSGSLTVTGLLVSARRQVSSASVAVTAANQDLVGAVADDVDSRLIAISDRLERAGISIAAEVDLHDDEPDSGSNPAAELQIEASGLLEADSIVRAICYSVGSTIRCDGFNGPRTVGTMPLETPGLALVERGTFAGSLALGSNADGGDDVVVTMVLEPERLLLELQRGLPYAVSIPDLPGVSDDSDGVNPSMLSRDLSAGGDPYLTTRSHRFLGQSVTVVVAADPAAFTPVEDGDQETLFVIGLALTTVLALAAYASWRRYDQVVDAYEIVDVERQHASERFRTAFTHSPIGVIEIGGSGRIEAVNPRFASQLGFTRDELVGADLIDMVDGDDRAAAREHLDNLLSGERTSEQAERRYRDRNGQTVWMRESAGILEIGDSDHHVLIHAEDISEERRQRASLHRRALFDELTGLPNRANMSAQLGRALEASAGGSDLTAVIFIDLDRFKEINDEFGHEAGDTVLKEAATRLNRVARASDTVARLGGDEFVVVCAAIPDETVAEECAQRFSEALRFVTRVGSGVKTKDVEVRASMGLAVSSGDMDPEQILREADQAMYQAKNTGRHDLVRFTRPEQRRRSDDGPSRSFTLQDLDRGLAEREFIVHFHPIMAADDQTVRGLEALVRWDHPSLGLLVPSDFLASADAHDRLRAIDDQVLVGSLDALGCWQRHDPAAEDWFVALNLTASNYEDPAFAGRVLEVAEASGVEPRRVILERDEASYMRQSPTAVQTARTLRESGVRISVDHFGAGGASMSEVATLEFDMLKVDRSFVQAAADDDGTVLEAMQQMADTLGFGSIVEGVESEEQLAVARAAGASLVQGFHLCRPMDADAIAMQFLALAESETVS